MEKHQDIEKLIGLEGAIIDALLRQVEEEGTKNIAESVDALATLVIARANLCTAVQYYASSETHFSWK